MAFSKQSPGRRSSAFRWLGVVLAAMTVVVLGAARDSYGGKREMDNVAVVRGFSIGADAIMADSASPSAGSLEECTNDESTDDGEPLQICPEPNRPCPPCVPAVDAWGYRIDRVPPQDPHEPCTGDHAHWKIRQQNPNNCQCFWKEPQRKDERVTCLAQGGRPVKEGAVEIPHDK